MLRPLSFVAAMSCVFICDNLGYLWVSIEATTLFSASLVYFARDKHALEATWKYLMVCSLGIAFALLAVLCSSSPPVSMRNLAAGTLNVACVSRTCGFAAA